MLEFPFNEVVYALFVGLEKEGPMLGQRTLFVVGDVPLPRIIECIKDDIECIYFGAGNRPGQYNQATILKLSNLVSKHLHTRPITITVEGPIIDFELLQRVPRCFWMLGESDFLGSNLEEVFELRLQRRIILKVRAGKYILTRLVSDLQCVRYDPRYDSYEDDTCLFSVRRLGQ
jgi:hypothetical protein